MKEKRERKSEKGAHGRVHASGRMKMTAGTREADTWMMTVVVDVMRVDEVNDAVRI